MKSDFLKGPLVTNCIEFSLMIIAYTEQLCLQRKYVVAQQLLKSGTSIGANAMEAQSAESKSDFIHKMKIADKEAQETLYWLILCQRSEHYPDISLLMPKLDEVQRLLNAIIRSSKSARTAPTHS